jgi:hypothetical protein
MFNYYKCNSRSYYFTIDEVETLLIEAGFAKKSISYVHRRTINKKDGIDVPRIFVQAEFIKTEVRMCLNNKVFAQQWRLFEFALAVFSSLMETRLLLLSNIFLYTMMIS